ncbi:MAG: hypothetical protein WD273_05655 [Trueperaceae bacterium]
MVAAAKPIDRALERVIADGRQLTGELGGYASADWMGRRSSTRGRDRLLTGAVKWSREPISIALHFRHLHMPERAAHGGQRCARQSLEDGSVLYYLAAGGFEEGFAAAVEGGGYEAICWSLEDVYG